MASRVLWLLFASWAVFVSMFAFASEYKIQSNDVKGYGASDERIDNNNIDWMGMSREDFIGKYPPAPGGTVHDKEELVALLASSDASEIYDLAYENDKPYIGMCVQLCDALPEALDNGMISGEKRANYRYHLKFWREDLYKYAKELMDKVGGFKLGQELRYRILLSIEARVLFQLCLKGRGDKLTSAEIRLLEVDRDEATDLIRSYESNLDDQTTGRRIPLIAVFACILACVVLHCLSTVLRRKLL
eukprot:662968_1